MVRCCLDGCSNESRWIRVKDGKVIGYYCDRHMTYLALKEDSMNNGLPRCSRWFRIGEFKEKGLREILEKEGGEATVERVAYLLGRSINDVLYITEVYILNLPLKLTSEANKRFK
mgnify:CR=1 FL=1